MLAISSQQILCISLIIWNHEKIFLGFLKILYLHNYWNLDAFYQKFFHMENFYGYFLNAFIYENKSILKILIPTKMGNLCSF